MKKQGVLINIQNHFLFRPFSKVLLIIFIVSGLAPIQSAFALTSGPSQPETDSFQQVDVSNMVDPFTGNFSYNIPLLDVGGYPINLSYASDITMDQEATWAGLGWNVNVGAITRSLRGLPDDFWGDTIVRNYNVKPNQTWGANVNLGVELFGVKVAPKGKLNIGFNISYNNYRGFNIGSSLTPSIQSGNSAKMNASLGLSASSEGGFGISPNVSFSSTLKEKDKANLSGSLGFGLSINSRTGLSNLTLNSNVSSTANYKKTGKNEPLKKRESKKDGAGNLGSYGNNSNISFSGSTYTPSIDVPMTTLSITFSAMLGAGVVGSDVDVTIGGFYSGQSVKNKMLKNPTYGYIYSEKANNNFNAILDFNREKDGSFSLNSPTLPVTNFTYDVFDIQAQGLGGSFRGFRNDMGFVYDKTTSNTSGSGALSIEVSGGNIVDVGVDVSMNYADATANAWINSNKAQPVTRFLPKGIDNLYENVYFKLAGEQNIDSDPLYFDKILKNEPVRFTLDGSTANTTLNNNLKGNTSSSVINQSIKRDTRQNRTTSITYLTVGEVKNSNPHRAKMISKHAKDHHIGEITIVKPDGTRYVFGLAAYNNIKREVTFAIGRGLHGGASPTVDNQNLVEYTSLDNSSSNSKGIDNLFDETYTPPYAHTWYLTEVFSPDYVDVTGNGPTEDDLGSFTMFTYGTYSSNQYLPNVQAYKWRTPTSSQPFKADYNEGLKTDITDDRANIVYGEKEVWYVNTIESKTQLAKFYLSNREDGFGVSSINGGVDTSSTNALKKIDRISLFSKEEYYQNPTSAVPIKTAYFKYDYSLCKGVPNNRITNSGKLTLKKIYFTYQKSNRARYSPYVFNYNENNTSENPNYDRKNYDRWGFYKNQLGTLTNANFPYTNQNKTDQDRNSAVWALKSIGLPSGGTINISYESDDYGYVQDKKATRMFKVIGTGATKNQSTLSDELYTGTATSDVNQYIFFDLEKSIPSNQITNESQAHKLIKSMYLDDENNPNGVAKNLYFRFLMRVNNGSGAAKNEYVSGYLEPDSCGVRNLINGSYTQGWIKVKMVQTGDNGALNAHPIAKAGWQFSRIYTPAYAYNQPLPTDTGLQAMMKLLASADIFNQLIGFVQGVNGRLKNKGFASTFVKNESWIKLIDPDRTKLGGGSRVKKIELSDGWNTMNPAEGSFTYGQEYFYTLEEGTSSGVAAFEPGVGSDENALKTPIFAGPSGKLLIPDDRFYQEEPMGESFFPSPLVGYSRVIIRNLQHTNVNVNATGHIVHNFYTAKDFPTTSTRTSLDVITRKSDPILGVIFGLSAFDYLTASQGFVIELNDMHGKEKSQEVFAQGKNNPISKVEYFYKTDTDGKQLVNNVDVINPDGTISIKPIGIDFDIALDMREQSSSSGGIDMNINTASFYTGIPFIVPTLFPTFSKETTRFRSSVVTKVINKYAVLEKTVSYDVDARVESKSIAWDAKTGQVLITQVNNEFEDNRYALNYPAHFAYEGMGAASTNVGFEFIDRNQNYWNRSNGKITGTIKNHLRPGDELLPSKQILLRKAINSSNSRRVWVAADVNSNGDLYLIDAWGNPYITTSTDDFSFKVIRSGMRNMQGINIGAVESLKSLITNNKIAVNTTKDILSSSAVEFQEQWKMNNNQGFKDVSCPEDINFIATFTQFFNTLAADGNLVIPQNDSLRLDLIYPAISSYLFGASCQVVYKTIAGPDQSCYPNTQNFPLLSMRFESINCPDIEQKCIELVLVGASPTSIFPVSDWGSFTHITNNFINTTPPQYCYGPPGSRYIPNPDNPDIPLFFEAVLPRGTKQYFYITNYFEDCFQPTCDTLSCTFNVNDRINPYLRGVLGNWRALKSYTYLTERQNTNVATSSSVRNDGYYTSFDSFWITPSSSGQKWSKTTTPGTGPWKWTAEMTNYSPWGFDVENKDPLGNYSAALYGYKNTLPIAVAQNAQYKEIGYDGFEDYYPGITWGQCDEFHFKFKNFKSNIDPSIAHTGNYSMRAYKNIVVKTEYNLTPPLCQRTSRSVPYILQACDLLGYFAPNTNYVLPKKYILSFWARESDPLGKTDFTKIQADVKLNGLSLLIPSSLKKSKVIDEWQQFEVQFNVPAAASGKISIEFLNTDLGNSVYNIDDVRIFPANATFKSFVYDATTLRYLASLDENNYATFYEYDEDGSLIRVKKETERGIMTIQENRSNNFKRNLN